MNLLAMQRRMAEDVRRPLTPECQMHSLAEDGTSMELHAATYIKPNDQLSSFERLEIYNRQYWFRIIEAVSEDFPALQAVLGPDRFDTLIRAYLKEHPSTSWTLRDLGASLPAFLGDHREFAGRQRGLAVDVARLEWAYVEAYDGSRLPPLTAEDMQAACSDLRLSLQPHLRLLALHYPADEVVLAVRKDTPKNEIVSNAASEWKSHLKRDFPRVKRKRTFLAVHRFDDSVYYRPLNRQQFVLLSALRDELTISAAIATALKGSRLAPEEQGATVQQCFAHASELGWLCVRRECSDAPGA